MASAIGNAWTGNWADAGLDLFGLVPGWGDGAKAAVKGTKIARYAEKLVSEVAAAQRKVKALEDHVRKTTAASKYWASKRGDAYKKLQEDLKKCKTKECKQKKVDEYKNGGKYKKAVLMRIGHCGVESNDAFMVEYEDGSRSVHESQILVGSRKHFMTMYEMFTRDDPWPNQFTLPKVFFGTADGGHSYTLMDGRNPDNGAVYFSERATDPFGSGNNARGLALVVEQWEGGNWRAVLLDINPLIRRSDACLFRWENDGDFDSGLRFRGRDRRVLSMAPLPFTRRSCTGNEKKRT